ncbi:histidine phosphatase family containing protein [Ceratobasidium sp. AG-Ba]|nr:histidine phosphatase family containing protein [Ceratobasidium sp. AG-Ba]
MITLTFVRHGESTDNLSAFWAGWKDACLSVHGMNQAKAVGKYFESYPITHMFASDLKRAHSTARAIYDAQPDPKPPLVITNLIREQHFGDGEGKPWSPQPGGVWSLPEGRDGKFSNAPIIAEAKGKPAGEVNVVVVSHGIAIAETLGAIVRRSASVDQNGWNKGFRGLHNTAWTRVAIGLEEETLSKVNSAGVTDSNPGTPPDPSAVIADKAEQAAPPPVKCAEAGPPSIRLKVIACNQHSHLRDVVRQKDGNASSGDDPTQKKLRDFFGGGGGD